MTRIADNQPKFDRRTLLAGGSLLVAGGVLARIGAAGWAGEGAFAISSAEAMTQGEFAHIVLSGDRLDRLVQLRAVLSHVRPQQVGLKIDDADQVMFDIPLAEVSADRACGWGGTENLNYRRGAMTCA